MNTKLKRILLGLLMSTILCTLFAVPTFAASTRKCYTILNNSTTVYSNTSLTIKYGTIYGSDEISVITVTGKYSKVTYPISGGRTKTGYIRTNSILTGTTGQTYKAQTKITTYRRPGGASYGYVSSGDKVVILGTYGSYTQIKYPVSGGYKYGFVTTDNANRYISGANGNSSGISNGMYTVSTALKSSMVMDVYDGRSSNGTNIQIYQSNGGSNQKYNITNVGSGWYKIINVATNKAVDVTGGVRASNVNVQLYDYNGSDAQLWRFISAGNGYYYIQNKLGYYLDVYNNQTSNETNIIVYQFNGGNNQKWKLTTTSAGTSQTTYYVTTTAGLSLRRSASSSSGRIAVMPYGSAIQVSSISNGWARCVYNGVSGYCSSSYISRTKPVGSSKLSHALYNNAKAYISCGFDGYTTTRGKHEGIDIVCSLNAPVYSLTDGTVVRVQYGYNGSKGLSTIAIYDSTANKTVIYLHSNPLKLSTGQKVIKGQQIATQGWRGVSGSSGSHTHVEVRNGKQGYAAKSVNDYKLENPNPTSYWISKGYIIQ